MPEAPTLDVLYRDDHLIAIDKPSGLVVHRGWANDEQVVMTLVRDAIGSWVYPVHRLDRGTSGVLMLALSPESARELCGRFERGEIVKKYWALVRGTPGEAQEIDHPLRPENGGPAQRALTHVRKLAQYGRYAWLEAAPSTGRLHQIRRHLKHVSCPIIGDVRYGKGEHNRLFRDRYGLRRLALHACSLLTRDLSTGAELRIEAPLPADLSATLAALADGASAAVQHE
ncbi:MAG TPA: pseudouridine synthase [Polyangiaceae bacterium]